MAQRLDVPLRGVGLPGHFIVLLESSEPLAAYDPFRRGMCLSYLDCIQLVEQYGHTFDDSQLKPVTPRDILARSLNNLRQVYRRRNDRRFRRAVEQMLLTLQYTN
ncbi:MAG: transglutaminase family protein [Lentisphaeria bacterium]|nr:transglutaminase family protein [Lentisphaeria bacterium]